MIRETISQMIEETARGLGYLIYDISIYLKGENTKIIVKIDRVEGISHQDCEKFSRGISDRLDVEEILPNYSLEVSSPGIKRLVRNIEEFKRFAGAPVKIVCLVDGNPSVIKGRIENVDDSLVVVETEKGETAIPFDAITSANLDY